MSVYNSPHWYFLYIFIYFLMFLCDVSSTSSCWCSVTYASQMCEVLNQDLFSTCHEYLSPTPFHQQCRADTCKCGTPCLCSALAHYARQCRRFSVIIDFRSHISDCGEYSATFGLQPEEMLSSLVKNCMRWKIVTLQINSLHQKKPQHACIAPWECCITINRYIDITLFMLL